MPLLYVTHYTRPFIQRHRGFLFVFGDNLQRRGMKGQAAAARDEPNAVGIATKREPRHGVDAYLCDDDLAFWWAQSKEGITRLIDHAASGGFVIWPKSNIGTGDGLLPEKAPKIMGKINDLVIALERTNT